MTKPSAPLMGWFCSYTPIELIMAAGFIPYRIAGHSDPIEKADSHMHPNICQYVRACLDKALDGAYDHLDGFVFITSCDAMRRLYDVWRKHITTKFTFIFDLPVGQSKENETYFKNELQKLKSALEKFTLKEISEAAIEDAIQILDESRAIYQELNDLRKTIPPLISGTELMQLTSQFFSSDPRDWNRSTKTYLKQRKQESSGSKQEKNPRILLSGSPIHDPEIIALIEECGLNVVFEDLCTGSRFFDVSIERTGDILMDLSKVYLNKPPCSRMMLLENRAEGIIEQVNNLNVDGVIYYSLKFCDTALYDVPALKKILNDSNINVLFIEGDCTLGSFGQLKTRIEAFTEMISS